MDRIQLFIEGSSLIHPPLLQGGKQCVWGVHVGRCLSPSCACHLPAHPLQPRAHSTPSTPPPLYLQPLLPFHQPLCSLYQPLCSPISLLCLSAPSFLIPPPSLFPSPRPPLASAPCSNSVYTCSVPVGSVHILPWGTKQRPRPAPIPTVMVAHHC